MVDFIGKIETIDNSYEKIRKKYKLGKLPHYNSSDNCNWMSYYTTSLAKKVYKRYRNDFIKFGYQKDYYNLLKYLKNK